MSHTDPKSLANLYQPLDEVASGFSRTIHELCSSRWFCFEDFKQHEILLSEAYVLLWQNSETGDIDGRKVGLPLKVGAYAAVFLDLIISRKIEVYYQHDEKESRVRVIDDTATGTFLDDALFDDLRLKHHRVIRLSKWLEKAEESACVEIILSSLILRGILKKEKIGFPGLRFFRRFPTTNPEPEKDLIAQIRSLNVDEDGKVDSYIVSLLAICREADNVFLISDPILKKYFNSVEYPELKKKIDRIIIDLLRRGRPRSWYRPKSRNLTIGSSPAASPRFTPRISRRSSSMHEALSKTKSSDT
ncbi:uncharacterized protein LOC135690853 [Rhopilema esculentum]|uniref:uncharacterized protein LOC135690853 n=1 Tax=Rhopilema esculentum TaxID=499914 RepID=UPI0031E1DA4F|eukprot:gene1010-15334_t